MELLDLAAHIARVAIERDRAEHALRASEQLARSHVEVTMRSLDVLATEAAPEKFIAEMLRTISQHLGARSVMLWLCNQKDDALRLRIPWKGSSRPSQIRNIRSLRTLMDGRKIPFSRKCSLPELRLCAMISNSMRVSVRNCATT